MTYRRMFAAALFAASSLAAAQHDPAMHDPARHSAAPQAAAPRDARQPVDFPPAMREHTLANMRDHLLALQQIVDALARQEFDKAADIAENRLGMSSLALHGAHDASKFMPAGMRAAGTAMHRNASRFAVAAKDAGASGDVRPALGALAQVAAQCVACHAGWRFR